MRQKRGGLARAFLLPRTYVGQAVRSSVVMRGLDPRIHQERGAFAQEDGLPGPGYAKGFAAAFQCWRAEALAEAASPAMTDRPAHRSIVVNLGSVLEIQNGSRSHQHRPARRHRRSLAAARPVLRTVRDVGHVGAYARSLTLR
jgi:hypothetical protein